MTQRAIGDAMKICVNLLVVCLIGIVGCDKSIRMNSHDRDTLPDYPLIQLNDIERGIIEGRPNEQHLWLRGLPFEFDYVQDYADPDDRKSYFVVSGDTVRTSEPLS